MSKGNIVVAIRNEDVANDELRLFSVILRFEEAERRASLAVREEALFLAINVIRDHGRGARKNRLSRPIVLFELDHLRVGVVLLEIENIPKVRTAPGIDRLIGITYDTEIPMTRGQLTHDSVLDAVGVLVFVDKDVGILVLIGLAVFAIEAMIPICFTEPIYFKDLKRLHKELLKKDKEKSIFLNLEERIAPIKRVSSRILAKEPTKKEELDPFLQGWLDVLTVETIILKSGSALYVKTMVQIEDKIYRIGLLDREHILPEKMPIGSSVQLIDGYYTVIRPKKEVREQKEIDLLIRVIPRSNARILYRRVSGISMASSQEKLMKYDLPDTEDERP